MQPVDADQNDGHDGHCNHNFKQRKAGDWMLSESILGSGPPENQMLDIWNSYDLEKRKRTAKLNAGIIKE